MLHIKIGIIFNKKFNMMYNIEKILLTIYKNIVH